MKIHTRVLWIAKESKQFTWNNKKYSQRSKEVLKYSVRDGINSQQRNDKQILEDNSLYLQCNGTVLLYS